MSNDGSSIEIIDRSHGAVYKFKVMREDQKRLKKKIFLLNMLLSKRQISEEYFFSNSYLPKNERNSF